jgi:hypothetical protein
LLQVPRSIGPSDEDGRRLPSFLEETRGAFPTREEQHNGQRTQPRGTHAPPSNRNGWIRLGHDSREILRQWRENKSGSTFAKTRTARWPGVDVAGLSKRRVARARDRDDEPDTETEGCQTSKRGRSIEEGERGS